MNIKIRLLIAKIKPVHTLTRVIMYNSSIFFYKKCKTTDMEKHILSLKDSKRGKRCFIIGNGPSLRIADLEKLKNEDCFASNEIFKIFDQTSWRPKYYLIKDRYAKISPETIDSLDVETVFIGDYFWRFHEVKRPDAICLHEKYSFNESKLKVSADISKCFYNGATVSFGLMQIAAYMGYSEVYLSGFDHNYAYEIDSKGALMKTGAENAHFYEDETPKEIIGNVQAMTAAYESFKEYAFTHGITVKNATRGGKLEVFERVDFDELMKNE